MYAIRSYYDEDMIWKEQLGLMLNLRVMEVDFLVGSQSDDFVKSFAGAGLGSYNFV